MSFRFPELMLTSPKLCRSWPIPERKVCGSTETGWNFCTLKSARNWFARTPAFGSTNRATRAAAMAATNQRLRWYGFLAWRRGILLCAAEDTTAWLSSCWFCASNLACRAESASFVSGISFGDGPNTVSRSYTSWLAVCMLRSSAAQSGHMAR